MSGSIYLIKDDDELVEMTEQDYDSEDLLQKLLAKYPKLLAGEQMDSDSPRRWLLVSREMGVPAEEEGADRFALDHLFLDQDGIPTLVEVKRSSDTRIRREVVGQMLDYAANAVAYWPVEKIRGEFEATYGGEKGDASKVLADFLDDEIEPGEFWQNVRTNLQVGRVRLLFVADQIPSELRRIIEFLNAQMDPAEVLGVEIKQYVGQELQTLVPRVIGQTEASRKVSGRAPRWNETRFFAALQQVSASGEVAVAKDLLTFGQEITERQIEWGAGRERGSFTARLLAGDQRFSLFSVYTTGQFSVNFGWNEKKLGERGSSLSEKFRQLTNNEMGSQFGQKVWVQGWPMGKLADLVDDGAAAFKQLVRDFVADVETLAEVVD